MEKQTHEFREANPVLQLTLNRSKTCHSFRSKTMTS